MGTLPGQPTDPPRADAPAGCAQAAPIARAGSLGPLLIAGSAGSVLFVSLALGWAVFGGSGRYDALAGAPAAPGPHQLNAAAVSLSAEELFRRVSPAVVRIDVTKPTTTGNGSGFLVSPDGLVVTSHHVVNQAVKISVTSSRGEPLPLQSVAGADPAADLALLKVRGRDLPFLKLRAGGVPGVGGKVYVIGFPLGLSITISEGLVSSLHRGASGSVQRVQTTAAVSPGSSGGPVVGLDGCVIGVLAETYVDGRRLAQNLNMAVPAGKVQSLVEAYREILRRGG